MYTINNQLKPQDSSFIHHMPVIWLIPKLKSEMLQSKDLHSYCCPVYRFLPFKTAYNHSDTNFNTEKQQVCIRRNHNNNRTNVIGTPLFHLHLPISIEYEQSHWIKRGCAIFVHLDNF